MKRSARKQSDPDLGVLAARLMFGLQGELFRRSAEHGFDDLKPRHGAVLAYLDDDGIRPSELVRLSGRNKQTLGAILDELEGLGYLRREPDPVDRRAKLIVPTPKGLDIMRLSDALVAEIEQRYAGLVGPPVYHQFKAVLRTISGQWPAGSPGGPSANLPAGGHPDSRSPSS